MTESLQVVTMATLLYTLHLENSYVVCVWWPTSYQTRKLTEFCSSDIILNFAGQFKCFRLSITLEFKHSTTILL